MQNRRLAPCRSRSERRALRQRENELSQTSFQFVQVRSESLYKESNPLVGRVLAKLILVAILDHELKVLVGLFFGQIKRQSPGEAVGKFRFGFEYSIIANQCFESSSGFTRLKQTL